MNEPKILYVAPLEDFSGYATAARDYVRALDLSGCNLVTRSLKYDMGQYKQTAREAELADRDLQDVDIVISHTTPNESERKDGCFSVIYFAWETDRLPKEWVDKINTFDLALVPCDENIKASRLSGVTIPIVKVVHTFNLDKYSIEHRPFRLRGAAGLFKFLTICQFSNKKGVDALLKAYLSEFTPEDGVVLLLKLYINAQRNDSDEEKNHIVQIVQKMKGILRLKNYPLVYLIHSVLDDEDISRLYSTSDCYVMPSRGEGFSITHFDAMGYGVPPIAVGWGGPTEFITDKEGWLSDYTIGPVSNMPHPHDFMYTAKDNWAEPDINSLRKCMREAHNMWLVHNKFRTSDTDWIRKVEACKEKVKDFSYDNIGPYMRDVIYSHYYKWKAARER